MTNLVLSPISTDDLINRIATRTAELLQLRQPTKPDPADDLITPKEACELLKCTSVTLWRWEKKKRIQSYGIGGKKWYRRSMLLQSIVKK